jgi:hypothetical protein
VEARVAGSQIELSISDDGLGGSALPGTGLGLKVTERRLAIAYGNDYTLVAEPRSTGGFQVLMRFPYESLTGLSKLRDEHACLLRLIAQLRHFLSRPAPPSDQGIIRLRNQLKTTLLNHLSAEDHILYPRLKRSKDSILSGTAVKFSEQMGELAKRYAEYDARWEGKDIFCNWPEFCRETEGVMDALHIRIERENNELYPLLERRGAPLQEWALRSAFL